MKLSHTPDHPTLVALYLTGIEAAVEMWSGASLSELDANPEYLKGQVELLGQLVGNGGADDAHERIESDIRARVDALDRLSIQRMFAHLSDDNAPDLGL